MSERRTSRSASRLTATMAARVSLSPMPSSSVATVSLLLQGTTVVAASRRLGLTEQPEADESDFGVELDEALPTRLDTRRVTEAMLASGNTLRDMAMPAGSLVMMVKRGKDYIVPNGNIEIRRGDLLLIIKES